MSWMTKCDISIPRNPITPSVAVMKLSVRCSWMDEAIGMWRKILGIPIPQCVPGFINFGKRFTTVTRPLFSKARTWRAVELDKGEQRGCR